MKKSAEDPPIGPPVLRGPVEMRRRLESHLLEPEVPPMWGGGWPDPVGKMGTPPMPSVELTAAWLL